MAKRTITVEVGIKVKFKVKIKVKEKKERAEESNRSKPATGSLDVQPPVMCATINCPTMS